jgi:epoxyqueuosine reductase QueG
LNAAYLIKQEAYRLGFSYVGISKAAFLEDEAPRLDDWLKRNYNGQMSYMANHFDKRLDPRLLVEGAKSVVSLLYNYYTPHTQTDPSAPKISRYAYGVDYHFVVKQTKRTAALYPNKHWRSGRAMLCRLGTCDGTRLGKKKRHRLDWQKLVVDNTQIGLFFLFGRVNHRP